MNEMLKVYIQFKKSALSIQRILGHTQYESADQAVQWLGKPSGAPKVPGSNPE